MSQPTVSPRPPFRDALSERLRWAMAASLVLNLGLWAGAASIAKNPPHFDPRPVEITRVVIDKGRKIEKVVTKKQIEKKVVQAHKEIQKRRPEWKPPKPQPHKVASPPPKITKSAPPPPQGAHSRVIAALPDKTAPPPRPDDHTVLPGGNAEVGKPIEQQNPGNAVVNPPMPVKPVEPPPVKVDPPKVIAKVDPPPAPPAKVDPPKIDPPAPAPEKVEPPKRKGPTRDSEPTDQVKPEIPDELKHGEYKSFVRVKVEIDTDGSSTPLLRTSSGNPEIDRRVMEALKKWKWKPALKDGIPMKSVQLFKFEFLVE